MQALLTHPSNRRSAAVSIVALLASVAATTTPTAAHSRSSQETAGLDARVAKIAAAAHQQQGLRNHLKKASVMAWGN
jgi:hypothetical protein